MIRKIIHIDEYKCNGCGLCAAACHEGAIGMRNGKAVLLRDDYCDGLGDCLPVCPTGAITFTTREAAAYDEAAVKAAMAVRDNHGGGHHAHHGGGCPGAAARALHTAPAPASRNEACVESTAPSAPSEGAGGAAFSCLRQWPVQIKLAPVNAPYFDGADLLIAADCAAYACGDFHKRFMEGKVTLIGCPKLDEGDYAEKLTAILKENAIKSVTVARMEVPCCGGLSNAVLRALENCGKTIPCKVAVLSIEGETK